VTNTIKALGKWKTRLSHDFVLFDFFSIAFIVVSITDLWSDLIPDDIGSLAVNIWIVITFILIFKKRTDEFTAQCWNSATATAFALVVITPFVSGFIDGFVGELKDEANFTAFNENKSWIAQVAIFAIVFQAKRIRGMFA
jgi:hypothetical protein